MFPRIFFAVAVILLVPVSAFAQEDVLTRRDGFLMIWQSIRRPAEPSPTVFDDLPDRPDNGSLEVDYAANRGLIDDTDDVFRPDDPLYLEQALIWLFRSRNATDDPEDVNAETLPQLLERYPVANLSGNSSDPLSQEDLLRIAGLLDVRMREEEHEVSLYAEKFHGKGTAFGEGFNMYALTAAHRSFPHNTLVKVTNVSNGKSVVVRINDRGPFVHGRDMDLSLAAFTAIEDRSKGKFMATFERLGDVRLVDACGGNGLAQQRLSRTVFLTSGVPHAFQAGQTLTIDSDSSFVMRGIRYPDGTFSKFQDYILRDESFSFTPSVPGSYEFHIGTVDGRNRTMSMNVSDCSSWGL